MAAVTFIPGWASQSSKMRRSFHEQLSALQGRLAQLCASSGQAMRRATAALLQADVGLAESVIADHEGIAAECARVDQTAFVLLARQSPVAADLRAVVTAIQIGANVERMGGLAVHVAKIARRRHPRHAVPAEVSGHIADMGAFAVALSDGARDVLLSRDPRQAARIRHDDDAMDELHRQLLAVLMDRAWAHGVGTAVDVTLLGRFYERFADHAVEIARRVVFQATGHYEPNP
ncbi:phosphate transport system regulatory protein PhoU [Mycobacterium heckeshornense]|uniref:Phosphate-specific transport system accessory protein PhoU n=2 Tax=Mycobacterium heckeshornense TaxID=110505 RepID=A0A7R7GWW6_9MYCO|nr:phosphate transport system regulatory protein PhoU [Mycobacterium heckeshornense]